MEGLGLLVIVSFLILTLAIVTTTCTDWTREGFAVQPKVVPAPVQLNTKQEPKGISDVADLPQAPVLGLAETNSLPFQDPALMKAPFAVLNELKKDMDGFSSFELPNFGDMSDPAVKLPLTRFKGDYERVKDEVLVIQRNPGLQSQLTMDNVDEIAANLRYLQRTYRLYAANQMVPPAQTAESRVGLSEGFADADVPSDTSTTTPITPAELASLSVKLAVEIVRLQASGTNDPVIQSRVSVLSKMRQTVDDLNRQVVAGTLPASKIPIMKSDYNNFLPALGNSSAGIGGLISQTGAKDLSSLFNNYDKGDISGSMVAEALFEKYAEDLLKGTSFNVSFSYTSQRETEREIAKATQGLLGILGGMDTNHPGTMNGARGELDRIVRSMDLMRFQNGGGSAGAGAGEGAGFVGGRPPSQAPTEIGTFDWKKRVEDIEMNIRKAGLNPAEFGALPAGASVGSDYSWRGHAKMMCSRLATHSDPAFPEQMGCPPVDWRGWRL